MAGVNPFFVFFARNSRGLSNAMFSALKLDEVAQDVEDAIVMIVRHRRQPDWSM